MFTTPYLCDRRVYDKRGSWYNPNLKRKETLFFFIQEQPTLEMDYRNGLEELKETMTIVVFGEHPFTTNDKFECLGRERLIVSIENIYLEHNVLVQDMLKDRVGSMRLVLE